MPNFSPKKRYILNLPELFAETRHYIRENYLFVICLLLVNMVYMLCFKAIPQGIVNPLSIVWLIAYYVFLCFFYRYYYNLKPFLLSRTLLGSLAPSSKAMLLMFLVGILVVIVPTLPLFLGFDENYYDYYERYVNSFERLSNQSEDVAPYSDIIIMYGVMSLLAPMLICKPWLAWISSLRGRSSSFQNIGDRTQGNYWQFVIISAILLYPQAIAMQLDKLWHCNNWLDYSASTIIFMYSTIIFAKIYDFFYIKN